MAPISRVIVSQSKGFVGHCVDTLLHISGGGMCGLRHGCYKLNAESQAYIIGCLGLGGQSLITTQPIHQVRVQLCGQARS